jgi:hypothetical protein
MAIENLKRQKPKGVFSNPCINDYNKIRTIQSEFTILFNCIWNRIKCLLSERNCSFYLPPIKMTKKYLVNIEV